MKVKKGDESLILPMDFGLMVGALWCPADSEHRCVMLEVRVEELMRMRMREPKKIGTPTYVAVRGRYLELFPAAGGEGQLRLQYHPPVKEI